MSGGKEPLAEVGLLLFMLLLVAVHWDGANARFLNVDDAREGVGGPQHPHRGAQANPDIPSWFLSPGMSVEVMKVLCLAGSCDKPVVLGGISSLANRYECRRRISSGAG
ncbi:hypothetical protein B0H63DRAFT_458059 [Podospora didyma]|uniref:Uncharacterized protein n=1 Tax=Podospora didyma TaxID=330526 RepID=A0AAE0P4U7_9PEZI|nr:hypothetical protein B0H63DRAFT_458059 [Podospora didyma]